MEIYFSHKTMNHEIPENILNAVKSTFTKFEINFVEDGSVVIKVPKREKELLDNFQKKVNLNLEKIHAENSVLARKLAHKYGFK